MVLNTSFNENEPVVCEPKEALDCFLRTQDGCAGDGRDDAVPREQDKGKVPMISEVVSLFMKPATRLADSVYVVSVKRPCGKTVPASI